MVLVIGMGVLLVLAGGALGQGAESSVGGWPKGEKVKYPAEGQVSINKVRVRSGGGMNYYVCGVLTKGTSVVVHESRYGWLRVDAPKGTFSLIAAKYVDKTGNDKGVVNASVVRVRAWASHSKQNYATQCRLNKGDTVRIVGQETAEINGNKMDSYKIEPPEGKAFLWISDKYVRYVGQYNPKPVAERPDVSEIAEIPDIEKVLTIPATSEVPKSTDRTELQNLDDALRIEMRRPIAQRQLAEHLAKYLALEGKTKSKSIAQLSQGRIKEIRRHMEIQTALEKSASIKESYEESQKRMRELLKSSSTTARSQEKKTGEMTGRLKASYVFRRRGMQRWRLVDPFSGRNLCYIMPGKIDVDALTSAEGSIVSVSGSAVFDSKLHLDLVVADKMQSADSGAEDK